MMRRRRFICLAGSIFQLNGSVPPHWLGSIPAS